MAATVLSADLEVLLVYFGDPLVSNSQSQQPDPSLGHEPLNLQVEVVFRLHLLSLCVISLVVEGFLLPYVGYHLPHDLLRALPDHFLAARHNWTEKKCAKFAELKQKINIVDFVLRFWVSVNRSDKLFIIFII